MECFGTTDFDNNSRLITLSVIIISGHHCTIYLLLAHLVFIACKKILAMSTDEYASELYILSVHQSRLKPYLLQQIHSLLIV